MPTLAGPLYASGVPGVIGPVAEVTLATTSAAVTPGMWVCASGDPDSDEYTKATPSALDAAGSPAAMAVTAATPGNKFKIALQGDIVESSITGLAAGAPGKVAVATNAFSVRLARPRGGEYVGGKVDSEGNITIQSEAHRATSPHMLYNVTAYGGAASNDPFARFFGKSGGATGVDNWQPIQDALAAMGNSGGILYFPARDDGDIATYLVGTAAHGSIALGVGAPGLAKPVTVRGDAGFFSPQSIIVGDHDVTTFRVYDFGDSPDGTSGIGSVFSYIEVSQPISYQPETWNFWKAHNAGAVTTDTHMIPNEPHGAQGVYFIPSAAGTLGASSPVFPDEWQGAFAFPVGTQIYLTDHDIPGLGAPLLLTATTGGISGATPPAVWNQTPGGTTNDGTVVWTTAADNRIPEGLFFWVPHFFAHAINSSTIIAVEHCRFGTINGDAIHIEASAGGSSTDANGVRIEEIRAYVTAGAAVFFRGPDSNAGYTNLVDGLQNGDYTIDDRSFLQNTHVAAQSAACVRGAYCAWENPSPVSKITFIGCYAEGGQPASRVRAPAFCMGGLHANGFTDDSGPQFVDLFNADAYPVNAFATRNAWGLTDNWSTPNAKRPLGFKTRALPDNGFYFEVTGGTTFKEGNTQPAWNTTVGGTTADGGLTWTCRGASQATLYLGRFTSTRKILEYFSSQDSLNSPTFGLDYNDGGLTGSPGVGWVRAWSRDADGNVCGGFSTPAAAEGAGWSSWFRMLFGAGAFTRAWQIAGDLFPGAFSTPTGQSTNGAIMWNGGPVGGTAPLIGRPVGWMRSTETGAQGARPFGKLQENAPDTIIDAARLGLWLRADKGVQLNAAGTGIVYWSDRSGKEDFSRDMQVGQGAPGWAAAGTTNNSKPVVTLAGGPDTLISNAKWTENYATPFIVFIVGRQTNGVLTRYALSSLSGTDYGLFTNAGGTTVGIDGAANFSSASSWLNTTAAIGLLFDGASSKIFFNAKTAVATGNTGATPAFGFTGLCLGNYQNGAILNWIGEISEVVVVKSPTTEDISELFDYFGNRYALAIGP